MFAEFIEKVRELTRPATLAVAGRNWLLRGCYEEAKPDRLMLRDPVACGSVPDFAQAIREFAKQHDTDSKPTVWCNESALTFVLNPVCHEGEQEQMKMVPYTAALPQSGRDLSYPDFMLLLDLYGEAIVESATVRAVAAFLAVTDRKTVKYEDMGAFTNITAEATRGIEPTKTAMPKILTFKVPYGDPGYLMDLKYRLTIRPQEGSLSFRLDPMPWADRRHEQFVTRSLNDLKDALAASEDGTRPEVDVRVYRGAHDKRYVQND